MDETLKKQAYLEGLKLKNAGLEQEVIYARLEKQGLRLLYSCPWQPPQLQEETSCGYLGYTSTAAFATRQHPKEQEWSADGPKCQLGKKMRKLGQEGAWVQQKPLAERHCKGAEEMKPEQER